MFDIDFVFPYLNNKDSVWVKQFKDFCILHGDTERLKTINQERFEDVGLLPILLECLDKNMPWIRKIHIIVSNKEQIPDYIKNERVNVVLHKDIIPQKYLPTYNSTTIEMYLRRIPDLAEHFIYSNDDIFILNEMKPEDFFTEDGLIKLSYVTKKRDDGNQFAHVCYNNYREVMEDLGYPYDDRNFVRPYHSVTPMIKSHCSECIEKLGSKIFTNNITPFRNGRQHNQYIYPLWEKYNYDVGHSDVKFGYKCMTNTVESICSMIQDKDIDIFCFNDCSSNHRNQIIRNMDNIKKCFKERLK